MGVRRSEGVELVSGLGHGVAGLDELLLGGEVPADQDVQVTDLVEHG
jgi:hypothetical protein